jgi:hypothetical protein
MTYPKIVFLVIAAIAAGAPRAAQQQNPEPAPAGTPSAEATVTTTSSSEADEAAALIAKANAMAVANANARAASTVTNKSPAKLVEASPEARKKAREFGFRAEVYNGTTLFCRQDAILGSRIPLPRCMTAYEFDDYAVQLKIARDLMQNKGACNSKGTPFSLCGGLP